jgi:hypothetical protein
MRTGVDDPGIHLVAFAQDHVVILRFAGKPRHFQAGGHITGHQRAQRDRIAFIEYATHGDGLTAAISEQDKLGRNVSC